MLNTFFAADVRQMLDEFRRSADQVFGSALGETQQTASSYQNANEFVFSPAIESGWSEQGLCLRAILPGVTPEDVKAHVVGNQLVFEGERKLPEGWTKAGYQRMAYGKFRSAVTLPNGLDLDKVSCRIHDGVLDVTIPVAEHAKPRQIQIESGSSQKTIAAS